MVVGGVCLLAVLIGRLVRHGAGLLGVLNEVPAPVAHEFGPPAVQCESQAPSDLLEKDGLAFGSFIESSLYLQLVSSSNGEVSDSPWCF